MHEQPPRLHDRWNQSQPVETYLRPSILQQPHPCASCNIFAPVAGRRRRTQLSVHRRTRLSLRLHSHLRLPGREPRSRIENVPIPFSAGFERLLFLATGRHTAGAQAQSAKALFFEHRMTNSNKPTRTVRPRTQHQHAAAPCTEHGCFRSLSGDDCCSPIKRVAFADRTKLMPTPGAFIEMLRSSPSEIRWNPTLRRVAANTSGAGSFGFRS